MTRSKRSAPDDFPVDHYSQSFMVKFTSNPILCKIQYLNGDILDTATGAAGVLGKAFHRSMEVYYGGSDDFAITSESEAIEYGLKAGSEYLEMYNDGWINFTKTLPTKQKMIERFVFCFQEYVKYQHDLKEETIMTEEKLEEYVDIEWKGERLKLPIKLKGYPDRVVRDKDKRIRIRDYKTAYSFSNPDKIDGAKILQAIQYYLLVYANTGEEPYSFIFEEVKYTKNKDGSPQVRYYEMVFADNEQYFDLYFRLYDDITRALNGEMVWVPNLHALFDNEIALIAYIHRLDETETQAKLMKKHRVSNLTDLLKKQIQNAGNMKKLMHSVEQQFIQAKNINYDKMNPEERIQTKLLEHGMMLQFDSKIEGASVDLYRFNPSIGLKMSKLHGYTADVEQVLGVKNVRVLAPIPDTTLIGFEVPRKTRTFPKLPKGDGFNLAIGQNIMGEDYRFDLRTAPHMLVAGASGSGKSVFLNEVLNQLTKVKDAELHLFDPKMVELAVFATRKNVVEYEDDILEIHFALENLITEMEARYKQLAKQRKRNIDGTGLPYKIVVIDEYGDLIVQDYVHKETKETGTVYASGPRKGEAKMIDEKTEVSKEISKNILRLAQKGRAAGIHIIISTQRPSVDIVTGSIKANFPTKACFKTAKAIDSQVVLDEDGAEKLLGKGDMIFASDEGTQRLQGYFTN